MTDYIENTKTGVAYATQPAQLLSFYGDHLPASGIYCLVTMRNRRHYWCNSLEELAEQTTKVQDCGDVYYATASFNKPGDSHSGRTQKNVARLKSLRLDLDAGAKKLEEHGLEAAYATQKDAIVDVMRYSKEHGIAPGTIVSSGEGLHIYYDLEREVTPDEWLPIAKALHEHGTLHGLKIDGSVSIDSSRLLRPIGTLHPNGKRVKVLKRTGKVWSLADLGERLGHAPVYPNRPSRGINADLDLGDSKPRQHTQFSMLAAAKHCAALRMAMEDHGARTPYGPWVLALHTAALSVEGEGLGHEISDGHEDYDPAKVDRKMASCTGGPPNCETWHRAWGAKSPCTDCLYGGIGK